MLIIISTPIGNLGDITQRAAHLLAQVDIIACEDTRQTRKLLNLLGISFSGELWAYHDHNGAKMRPKLINIIKAGQQVALVSRIHDETTTLCSATERSNVGVGEDVPKRCTNFEQSAVLVFVARISDPLIQARLNAVEFQGDHL